MGILERIKGIFGKKRDVEVPSVTEVEKEPLTPYTSAPEHEALAPMREPLPRKPLVPEPLPPPPTPATPELRPESREADISNLRAKIDLLLTQVDSIKTQNQTINERLKAIEKTLAELRGIRYY